VARYSHLLQVILDEQREGILLFDEDLNIKIYNNSFKEIYKKSGREELSSIEDIFQFCHDLDNDSKIDREWFQDFDEKRELILTCTRDPHNKKYFQTITKKVKDYTVFSLTDITDLKQESAKLKTEAITDKLTGIYNRKVIEVSQNSLINTTIHMILLDIDNFKKVNDTYGHMIGDKVLVALTNILQKALRKNDLAIRWGGEEFVILLKDIPSLDIAKTIAEHLRKNINEANIDKVENITCSFGVASKYIEKKEDLDTLFQEADVLLYKAKANGKNRVEATLTE